MGGRTYAISRFFGPVPVHLIGCGLSLDHRAAGQRGAAAINPHGLVQEFLNRSPNHLWAILSNGLRLRVLRDNQALSRQSFLEFDLEIMFTGEVYSDFVLLWLMAHASRFAPREGGLPETCWLEKWAKEAEEQGTRALGNLRVGVEKALQILGEGFTGHPKNSSLRDVLRTGKLLPTDFHGQLLRVVYRLIFLFVAEDRALEGQSLLHPIDDSDTARLARERFATYYSSTRLRDLAGRIKGSRHGDLWRQFQLLVKALSGDTLSASLREKLALPALGSFLWDPASTQALNETELTNHDLLEALRYLAFTRQGKVLRPVDYKNLGAEELGGVYESLLALTPQISDDGAHFTFAEFSGNERKTSGSYYTPDSLVQCLLDSALDPVVEEAIKGKKGAEAEKALLALKVCDPAVGSGHFLVGAAHRLARHLARVRALAQGDSEPSPLLYQHALRDVIGSCLYGVDLNSMAAELCRVSLWLEALEPGKPLSFLDHHIRVGNSLLGATPELISAGLPDEAFAPIAGDEKEACKVLKRRNRAERERMGVLFSQQDEETQARLEHVSAALDGMPDERPEDIRAKESAFNHYAQTEEYKTKKMLADSWCAAFLIRKCFREPGREDSVFGITQGQLDDLSTGRPLPAQLATEVELLCSQYLFFHWHLAFPRVFEKGGFDCVLGNPPWEHTELKEKEFFARVRPDIASAKKSSLRKKMIANLQELDPRLFNSYSNALRAQDATANFFSASGLYPYCGKGRINLFAVFAERMHRLVVPPGNMGCVIPSGIGTDDTTKDFFAFIVSAGNLRSFYEFENEGFFPEAGSGHMNRFCLFTAQGPGSRSDPSVKTPFLFQGKDVSEIDMAQRILHLSPERIALLNPNTKTAPICTTVSDLTLLLHVYRCLPIIDNETSGDNPWAITFKQGLYNATTHSDRFLDRDDLAKLGGVAEGNVFHDNRVRYIPVYEAKMMHQYDHRFGDYNSVVAGERAHRLPEVSLEGHEDPLFSPMPKFWVSEEDRNTRTPDNWNGKFLLGWRDVTDARASARTVIASALPPFASEGGVLLAFTAQFSARNLVPVISVWNTFAFDWCARQKVAGNHLKFFTMRQLPMPIPDFFRQSCVWASSSSALSDWLLPYVLELTYTAWDIEPFAKDCGWSGPPFRWDDERRFLLRCELDAAVFQLYIQAETNGSWRLARSEPAEDFAQLKDTFPAPVEAIGHIMDTFSIVRRKEEEKWGEYRSKLVILEMYEAMQEAIRTGQPYQTRLDPPPADPRCCHPSRKADHS